MRTSDFLIETLLRLGIKNVYALTGRGSLFLTDAIARAGSDLGSFLYHEQSAGFAACAESQLRSELSVCITSTGCGATNVLTPMLGAWQDELPVIFITGQHYSDQTTALTGAQVRTFGEQEADITALSRPITKFSATVGHPEDLPRFLEAAVEAALTVPWGPVHLDIPLDIQSAQIDKGFVEEVALKIEEFRSREEERFLVERGAVQQRIFSAIELAERPLFLFGANSITEHELREVIQIASDQKIPFVYESGLAGRFDHFSDGNMGCLSALGGSRAAGMAAGASDLIIALGSHLRRSTIQLELCGVGSPKEIFTDSQEPLMRGDLPTSSFVPRNLLLSSVQASAGLVSELNDGIESWWQRSHRMKVALHHLATETLTAQPPARETDKSETATDLHELSSLLERKLPSNCTLVTDSGSVELILPTNIQFSIGQRVVHPTAQGSMGFALGAAVGASRTSDAPVIAVIGDGSFLMNLQELSALKAVNANVLILVIDNDLYGIIRKRQSELFRGRTIGVDQSDGLWSPDLGYIAKSFGYEFIDCPTVSELGSEIEAVNKDRRQKIIRLVGKYTQFYTEVESRRPRDRPTDIPAIADLKPFLDGALISEEFTKLVS